MVSCKIYNLNANEDFVVFLTSKIITWFIGSFTLKLNLQPIAYLLKVGEHIYWIWDLEGEVHSTWDLWISGLQECKGNGFLEVGRAGISFRSGLENLDFQVGQLLLPESSSPKKFVGGNLTSSHDYWDEPHIEPLG
jgi:hypothetical protein